MRSPEVDASRLANTEALHPGESFAINTCLPTRGPGSHGYLPVVCLCEGACTAYCMQRLDALHRKLAPTLALIDSIIFHLVQVP